MSRTRQLTPEEKEINNLFAVVAKYPIIPSPVRYAPYTHYLTSSSVISNQIHSINYIINENIRQLIPNINKGYQMQKHTKEELINWIQTSKQYLDRINQAFQAECDKELNKLYQIENQKDQCRNFDINMLSNLPEDIILHIRRFLLPECRISELLAAHPEYLQSLQKLTTNHLKKFFIDSIYRPYYASVTLFREDRFYLSGTFKNKTECISKIHQLFQKYSTKITNTPEEYTMYQTKALKILQAIIYVGYHTGTRLHKNR